MAHPLSMAFQRVERDLVSRGKFLLFCSITD